MLKQDWRVGVRNILTALILADDIDELVADAPPGWRIPGLRETDGTSGAFPFVNWRITFEERNGAVERLDLEDYH